MKRRNLVGYYCPKCGALSFSVTLLSGTLRNPKDTDLLKCNHCGSIVTRKEWYEAPKFIRSSVE